MRKLALLFLPFAVWGGEIVVTPNGPSPEDALQMIRKAKAGGNKEAWTVRVKSGNYLLAKTLTFTPADSGTPKAPVTWIGEKGATISGGGLVGGWTRQADGVWAAPIPCDAAGKPIYFEQLWVNGRRASRSRLPNTGYLIPADGQQKALRRDASGKKVLQWEELLTFTNADVNVLARLSREEMDAAQVLVHHKWSFTRRILRAFDAEKLCVKTTTGKEWPPWKRLGKGSLCYFENIRAAFDQPGEWFYDVKAKKILYRPLPGEDMTKVQVIAPTAKLSELVAFKGDYLKTNLVHDITFKGLTFAYSDAWTTPGNKGPTEVLALQAANQSNGAITAEGVKNVTFDSCTVAHTGNYGFRFNNGCTYNKVINCALEDLGAGGIWMGATGGFVAPGDRLFRQKISRLAPQSTAFNVIDNCIIRHGGLFNPEGTGIALTHASDCKVTHCEIYDLFYTGISVGWTWGYAGSVAQRNEIAFNKIHDLGKGQMADMGGVYTLGTSFGTRVHGNVVYNVRSYSYGGWGLYTDEGSEGIVMENNLVYNTHDAGFHQHYGVDCIIRNNIFCFNETTGVMRTGRLYGNRGQAVPSTLHFQNNICYTKTGPLISKDAPKVPGFIIKNLWYVPAGTPVEMGACTNYADWVKSGREIDGMFADPQFVDADNLDFRLKPTSPAFKLGFKAFDFSKAGLRR